MSQGEKHTLIKRITVADNDVDFTRKYTLCGLMRNFHNLVSEHADMLHVDANTMLRNYNAIWIITRVRIELQRMPEWGDEIELETWVCPPGAVRLEREALFRDKTGEFARLSSEWCLIDKTTNFPCRPQKTGYPVGMIHRNEKGVGSYEKLSFDCAESDFRYSHKVMVSDLDFNGHMNNVAYIRLACDVFSGQEVSNMPVKAFEIAFKTQCYEGESMNVYRKNISDGKTLVCAEKTGDKHERIFDAAFTF